MEDRRLTVLGPNCVFLPAEISPSFLISHEGDIRICLPHPCEQDELDDLVRIQSCQHAVLLSGSPLYDEVRNSLLAAKTVSNLFNPLVGCGVEIYSAPQTLDWQQLTEAYSELWSGDFKIRELASLIGHFYTRAGLARFLIYNFRLNGSNPKEFDKKCEACLFGQRLFPAGIAILLYIDSFLQAIADVPDVAINSEGGSELFNHLFPAKSDEGNQPRPSLDQVAQCIMQRLIDPYFGQLQEQSLIKPVEDAVQIRLECSDEIESLRRKCRRVADDILHDHLNPGETIEDRIKYYVDEELRVEVSELLRMDRSWAIQLLDELIADSSFWKAIWDGIKYGGIAGWLFGPTGCVLGAIAGFGEVLPLVGGAAVRIAQARERDLKNSPYVLFDRLSRLG